MKINNPVFITIEGCDCSGKTSLIKYLKEKLDDRFVFTREPSATFFGHRIRNLLLDQEELSATVELFLFMADRAQHTDVVIKDALSKGKNVICDRWLDSTLAYQMISNGSVDEMKIVKMYKDFISDDIWPDMTILLDGNPERLLLRRIGKKQNRIDKKSIDFHKQVRKNYKKLVEIFPGRFRVVDCEKKKEDVFSECLAYINQKID